MPQRASGDRLALEFQDEAQHAVRRRVLRAHVDHDALVAGFACSIDDLVPVLPAAGQIPSLAGHQLYALRSSGGGIVAPWYSTGIAAERVVLALRVTGPVVGHLDAGQRGVASNTIPKKS